jgi:hypothetical protein
LKTIFKNYIIISIMIEGIVIFPLQQIEFSLKVQKLLPMSLISIDFLPIHEFRHVFCTALLGPVLASCSFFAQVSFWWTQSDKSRMAVILVSSIIMNDLTQNLLISRRILLPHSVHCPQQWGGRKLHTVHVREIYNFSDSLL